MTSWTHGTIAGYEKCNGGGRHACADCREAHRADTAARRRRIAYGVHAPTDLLDPTRTMQALTWLTAMGHSNVAIAHLTGLSHQSVRRMLIGDSRWVYRDTQDRVLAGLHFALRNPQWRRAPAWVPSDKPWQQLRSLSALGWDLSGLCRELGYKCTWPPFDRQLMSRRTAERIQQMYDRLSGTRGPSARAAAHAARLGWHVPLAYDDDGRLIPEAIPNALSEARERRERRAEQEAEVTRLTAMGLSAHQIAERLGITDRTVTRNRVRKDLAS